MIRGLLRFAALAGAAAASAALIGGAAHAGEPSNQGGPPGEGGSATSYCSPSEPAQDDAGQVLCTATPGKPGAPGPAVDD
jgi:hypothetical protein